MPRKRRRHDRGDTHATRAAAQPIHDGQASRDYLASNAVAGEGHIALAALIAQIRESHLIRRAHMLAAGDMERRIKSRERWIAVERLRRNGLPLPAQGKFPKVTAEDEALALRLYPSFHAAARALREAQREIEKPLARLVRQLPVHPWAKAVRGLGDLSLATIVGEAGDIGAYDNPAKLWKRMGLAVIDGRSQRKATDREAAARQGYNPLRRSQMFVIGDCLIKAGGPLKAIYDAKKAEYLARDGMTKLHAHKMAQRYIEKRLLRDLWRAWRAAKVRMTTGIGSPPAEPPSTTDRPAHAETAAAVSA